MILGFRGSRYSQRDQFGEQVIASGHKDGPLPVFHQVGVIPHSDFRSGEVGGIDGQSQISAVGQYGEGFGHVGECAQVGGEFYINDGNTAIRESFSAVLFGEVGCFEAGAIEFFFVFCVNIFAIFVNRNTISILQMEANGKVFLLFIMRGKKTG